MRRIVLLLLVALLVFTGYRAWKARQRPIGEGFVMVRSLTLWSRVAQVKEPVTKLHNGERVWILQQRDGWSRVETDEGKKGWVQNEYLTNRQTYEQFVQLGEKHAADPVQAQGHVRALSNLRLQPGRDTARLFQVDANDKVAILGRAVVPAPPTAGPAQPPETEAGTERAPSGEASTGNEEWYLVRAAAGPGDPAERDQIGWIYARQLAFDPPGELLGYAGEKRYLGWFVLNQVRDTVQGMKSQYLVLAAPPAREGEGELCDFTELRVFTWNTRAHRYETAFRQRNICGHFPARLVHLEPGTGEPAQAGAAPVFAVTFSERRGRMEERIYQLQQTVVRRFKQGETARKHSH